MASKRAIRRRSCESKIAHPTKVAAAAHAWWLQQKMGQTYGIYRCRQGHWHAGRPTAKTKAAREIVNAR
jgi:hypothetical protein